MSSGISEKVQGTAPSGSAMCRTAGLSRSPESRCSGQVFDRALNLKNSDSPLVVGLGKVLTAGDRFE